MTKVVIAVLAGCAALIAILVTAENALRQIAP